VCIEHLEYFTLELVLLYRGADKSLARPWKETSYSDQDLQHYTKTYGVQTTGIYSCCFYAVNLGIVLLTLGPCSLFPFRVRLRTYQHPSKLQMYLLFLSYDSYWLAFPLCILNADYHMILYNAAYEPWH